MLKVRKAGVIGAGTMGAAIAEVLAYNEIPVILKDVNDELVSKGMQRIRTIVTDLVKFNDGKADKEIARIEGQGPKLTDDQKTGLRLKMKSKFTSDKADELMARVRGTTSYADFSDVDLVIEAAFENVAVKRGVFEELDKVLSEGAILGSNTSSLSITSLAKGLKHTPSTLITHFFNPPYTLPLVEVVAGSDTRDEVTADVIAFLQGLKNHRSNLVPIRVKEVPGFVVNRLLIPMINEACFSLDEGTASAQDIDSAMKAGAGMPMGPLELADMIGLDVCLDVINILSKEFGDSKYRAAQSLKRKVEAGHYGRKSGKGFYNYP
jgi:3-hydroxybutyryl-CoA dehydrogenase